MESIEYKREILAFDEKIALAKLEESKASERVKELEFQRARFCMDFFLASLKQDIKEEEKKDISTKVN